MASAVTNTTTTVSQTTNTTAVNPKGQLGSQDFMKLLLVELQYQDPTSPMDSDKMLTQTSQLSALEAQNATKTAMENMTKSFQTSASYGLAGAIGKMADTGLSGLSVSNGVGGTFDVYLPEDTTTATINITDSVGNTVRSLSLDGKTKGVYSMTWDAAQGDGTKAADGVYKVAINYTDLNGKSKTGVMGAYPIEGVQFNSDGEAKLKVGNNYVAVSSIKTIY